MRLHWPYRSAFYQPIAYEPPDLQSQRSNSERGDMRTHRLPRTSALHKHVRILVPASHRPTFVSTAECRSTRHYCRIPIDPDRDIIAFGTIENNFICFY